MGSNASVQTLQPDDVIDGRYRVVKTVGEGGMGTVYQAEHMLIKRRVAVKVLHPELASDGKVVERFMNEARAAGTLGHPNIVESTDMGFMESRIPYIVFEYLEGSVLTDEIYRLGGLPVRRAVTITRQIASALHAAHAANIVHRDLKSENVFLTDRDGELDHVKVLDFGISKFLEGDDVKTRRGMIMGTPEFMAPEQISDPDSVDARSDVYALGVILYELLTGRRPFTNDDPRTLLHRIVHSEPPPIDRPEVPRGLQDMVFKLLEKNPDDRFQSMADVEEALILYATQNEMRTSRPSRLLDSQQMLVRASTSRIATTRNEPVAARDTPWPARRPQTPYPDEDDASHVVSLPAVARAKVPWVMYALVSLGMIVGGIGLYIGLRAPVSAAPPAVAPLPAPAPAAAIPQPAAPAKVAVAIESSTPGARVTFRRRIAPAPLRLEVAPTDIVELVEVSAPDQKTVRYWITIDRPTTLRATLTKGKGMSEASEEATLIALGEATIATPKAPASETPAARVDKTPAPAPAVAAASVKPVKARKIGKAAADGDVASGDSIPAMGSADPFASRGPDLTKTDELPAPAIARTDTTKDETKVAAVAKTEPEAEVPAPPKAKPPVDEKAMVSSQIRGRRGDIIKCYEPARQANPRLRGDVTVIVQVDAAGAVTRPQVQSTLNAPMVAACIAKSMKSWKFRARAGGATVTASYKFELY